MAGKTVASPFGFGDVIERTDVPEGDWLFAIGAKSNGSVSSKGNPMVVIFLDAIDPELPTTNGDGNKLAYWAVRTYLSVRGEAAGMFHAFLSRGLGEDADAFVASLYDSYDGDGSAKSVAEFFDEAVVPQFIGRQVVGRVTRKLSDRTGQDGEFLMNTDVKFIKG